MGNKTTHRTRMEKKLGRKLVGDEEVHHINCNRSDNRIENLLKIDRKEHTEAHIGLTKLVPVLIDMRVILFDRSEKKYYLNPLVLGVPLQKTIPEYTSKPMAYFARRILGG